MTITLKTIVDFDTNFEILGDNMKKFVLFLFGICISLSSYGCAQNVELDKTIDMTPRLISTSQTLNSSQIAETVKSAIVGISANYKNGKSIGSGVAIANNGYILTNHHVISGAKNITLYFADKSTGSANIIWSDSSQDIAIIKSNSNMPYLDVAPLSEVAIGDDVLAVGTPLSLQFQHTFTKGIVSALNRTIEIQSLGGYVTYMQNLIQHDASINSGNSGGPLINSEGKVIGINSLKASDAEGIGFAIPIEVGISIAERVIDNSNFEQVYLGIFACDAELAKYKKQTDLDNGAFVLDIAKNSPLKDLKFNSGVVITNVNDIPIKNTLDFRKAIYKLNKGQSVIIKYNENGEDKEISLTI